MSFTLIIFDYDGVLIDSLDNAISVGAEFCRSIPHNHMPTRETIEPGDKAKKILGACNYFGVDPGLARMIGDTVSDIRYAKRAGVQSIAVTWGWQSRDRLVKEDPDFIVNSVQELADLIESEYSVSDIRTHIAGEMN